MSKTGQVSLTVLLAAILISGVPVSLDAQDRRGAELVVTAKNGNIFQGELVALKADSLLLIDHATGRDVSVALVEVSVIRVARESKALTGLLIGFVPGAVGGAVWGAHAGDEDMAGLAAVAGGLFVGGIAGLVGLAAGLGLGLDTVVPYGDLPEAEGAAFLVKLDRHARAPGVHVPKSAGPAAGGTTPAPAPVARGWTRFRLVWMPAYSGGAGGDHFEEGAVPFRFTESLPPGEAGPYSSTYYWAMPARSAFSLSRFSLGYQWSRRFGVEVEFSAASKDTIEHLADLRFTSTVDGLAYWAVFGADEITRSASVLAGLTYRALVPTDLQPHAVEAAVAAGPAWLDTSIPSFLEDPRTVERKVTWTARVRISYDYHFSRALAMGVFGEFRRLRADIPAYAMTEDLDFQEINNTDNYVFRLTEVTLPARKIDMGGFAFGLRFGFGF